MSLQHDTPLFSIDEDRTRMDALLSAFDALRIASHQVSRAGAAASGIALSDLRALVVVQREVGIKPGALALALRLTPSGMTAVIDRLVASGTLRRTADPHDRRSQRLEVTAAGEDALELVRSDYVEAFSAVYADAGLDERGLDEIASHFLRLTDAFERVGARRSTGAVD